MNNIKISLIITTYNQPDFLDLTLASVVNQSFKDFEVLIADDGSDNNTKKIIKKYIKYLNIKHIWHENKGYRKAQILNKTIKKSKGDYIIFIDGDCILHKDFLFYHYKYRKKGYVLSGRRVELGSKFTQQIKLSDISNGKFDKINFSLLISVLKKDSKHFHRSIVIENKFIRKIAKWNYVPDILGSNFSLYKSDLMKVNGFNENLTNYWGEDGDIFIRLRNSRIKLKSLKNIAIQYHLYHKRRKPNKSSVKWYYDALENNFTYTICKNGLKKIRQDNKPEASIIVLTYNQLKYTKKCINSIYKNTRLQFELIIVDNGSTDGTVKYLKELQEKKSNIKLILNKRNIGVARGWNQGIKASKADYIAILNNDIIVTPNWLKNCIRFSIEKNYLFVGPAFREGKLNYEINKFYKTFTTRNRNRERKNTYAGFAMVFHKSIFEKVGYFSEEFKKGTYEDVDFIMRLLKNKIPFATTGSAFVHHFKSKTQDLIRKKIGNNYEHQNREIFIKKWGIKSLKGISEPKNKLYKEYLKLKMFFRIW